VSLEDNKALVRRFIDEVMNTGNTAAVADFFVPGSLFAGATEAMVTNFKTAFPDGRWTIDDMVAEGDKVAVRLTGSGTNTGSFRGQPPTGKSGSAAAMYFYKISQAKIVSGVGVVDNFGALQQLGWTFVPPGQT
jgi:predicted ester cyclase